MIRKVIIFMVVSAVVFMVQPAFATKITPYGKERTPKRQIPRQPSQPYGKDPIKYRRPQPNTGQLRIDRNTGQPIKVLQAETNVRPRQPVRYVPRSPQPVKHVPRSPRVDAPAVDVPVKRPRPPVKYVPRTPNRPSPPPGKVPIKYSPPQTNTGRLQVDPNTGQPIKVLPAAPVVTPKQPVKVIQEPKIPEKIPVVNNPAPPKQNFGFKSNPSVYEPKPMPKRFQGGFWNRETKK